MPPDTRDSVGNRSAAVSDFARLLADGVSTDEQVTILRDLDIATLDGESLAEMAAMLRDRCVHVTDVPPNATDLCGTGGDGRGTFNISTTAAFVAAGAGVPVVKHGNRAVSSRCGSTDCLTALDIECPTNSTTAAESLKTNGIVFLSAPAFHPALAGVMEARRLLSAQGRKTVFNVLGPLVNPAFVARQSVGVFRAELIDPVAHALRRLGTERAMVFHGDGLDEITLCGQTLYAMLIDGEITRGVLQPEEFGIARCPFETLAGGDATENAAVTLGILDGNIRDARRDIVLLNAAAGILVAASDRPTLLECVKHARRSIDSGDANQLLNKLRSRSPA